MQPRPQSRARRASYPPRVPLPLDAAGAPANLRTMCTRPEVSPNSRRDPSRPVRRGLAALLAAGLLAAPAVRAAQDRPVLRPAHDVTVSYDVDAPQVPVRQVRAQIAAGLRRARIDSGDATTLLLDPISGQGVLMLNGLHMYSVLAGRGHSLDEYLLDPSMQFTRAGTATVAGLPCTEWHVRSKQGAGTGCVTADGVLLRFAGTDSRGRQGSLVATDVRTGPLAPSLFVPPADFHQMTLPDFGGGGR